jgi:hypothetical protein
MTEQELKQRLHYIVLNEPNSIKAFVAKEALNDNNTHAFFSAILTKGCASGWVTSLNFYDQIHHFFNTYYDEIENIRIEIECNNSNPVSLSYDIKTTFSWMAFEHTALQLAEELKIQLPQL